MYRNFLAFLIPMLLVAPVFAGSVTLTWTPPTENEDGTPLTDLAGYKLYRLGSEDVVTLDNPELTTYQWDNVTGTQRFTATAFNTKGVESEMSNEAVVTVQEGFVTTDTKAYVLTQTHNVLTLGQIGIVPLGTPCDESTTVNGKYRVDVEEVSPPVSSKTAIVVVECGFGN